MSGADATLLNYLRITNESEDLCCSVGVRASDFGAGDSAATELSVTMIYNAR
jgi:hypothetical protein